MLTLKQILATYNQTANVLIYAEYPQNPWVKPRVLGNHYAERWCRALEQLDVDYPVAHYNFRDEDTWVLLIECPNEHAVNQLCVEGHRIYEDLDFRREVQT